MGPANAVVERMRTRILLALYLEEAVLWGGVALIFLAAIRICARQILPVLEPWTGMETAAALGACALLAAALRAGRRAPSPSSLAARADLATNAGGLLLAVREVPHGTWAGELAAHLASQPVRMPAWAPAWTLSRALPPLALFLAALAIPARPAEAARARAGAAGTGAAERLGETVRLLGTSEVLGQEEARALREQLDALRDPTRPFDGTEWEALDALAERLRSRLQAAERAARQGAEAIAALDGASEAGEGLSGQLDAVRRLEEAVRTLQEMGIPGAADLPPWPDAARLPEGVAPDAAALREMLKDVEPYREFLEQMRDRLAHAPRARDAWREIERRPEWNGGAGGAEAGDGTGEGGAGGVGRGRGDADLEMGPATDRGGMTFRPEDLPPGAVWDPAGMVFSVQAVDPTLPTGETPPAGAGSALPGEAGPGQVTWKRDAWPQHQDVLRRYFGGE